MFVALCTDETSQNLTTIHEHWSSAVYLC